MSVECSPVCPDVPILIELGYLFSNEDYRTTVVPQGVPDHVKERPMAAAAHTSTAEAFVEITEGTSVFQAVCIGHEEMDANVRRIRAATEAVMAG